VPVRMWKQEVCLWAPPQMHEMSERGSLGEWFYTGPKVQWVQASKRVPSTVELKVETLKLLLTNHKGVSQLQHPWRRRKQQSLLSTILALRVSGRNSVCPCRFTLIYINRLAGDAVVINPEISSGLPIASINRRPQPASRPEQYSTPATKGATR
jgi:hypothetical protein